MIKSLSLPQVEEMLNNAVDAFPHNECLTCECFLGYVSQLGIDSDKSNLDFIRKYKRDRKEIHSCLGCAPCPPGDHYTEYLRENAKNKG